MRLATARIEPLDKDELSEEQARLLSGSSTASLYPPATAPDEDQRTTRPLLNSMRTIARMPQAYAWLDSFGAYVSSTQDGLSVRERQIVILRTAFCCKSGYVWGLHSLLTQKAGSMTEAEISRLKVGAEAGWHPDEALLIRATDELCGDRFISETTWMQLQRRFSVTKCMDLVFTAGQYALTSTVMNTFGVQPDATLIVDDDLKA